MWPNMTRVTEAFMIRDHAKFLIKEWKWFISDLAETLRDSPGTGPQKKHGFETGPASL